MHDLYATAVAIYTAALSKGEPATPGLQTWAVKLAIEFSATFDRLLPPAPPETEPEAEPEADQ